jgi:imidazoleglycerol-phosphate dehydratase
VRQGRQSRRTRETNVSARINLDGTGLYRVRLADRWVKHMIESLARFGRFDVEVSAAGDLKHHVLEDVAITLGRTFREAVGDRPIARVGSAHVAMDEALVLVTVDLVDRPYVDVSLPDEMLEHFLRSFAHEARLTLHNVVMKGRNPHHINEATFKALGMALHQATRPSGALVSTKGRARYRRGS